MIIDRTLLKLASVIAAQWRTPVPHLAIASERTNMRMAHVAMNLSRFPSIADSGKNRLINESTTFIG
ncbi:hypothetical protein B8P98_11645 [Klebsiella quasivariicola]|nr:hypothetical protein B8P98_11645 [Klebsiella quasivariicola]